jgi:hypothetical protein
MCAAAGPRNPIGPSACRSLITAVTSRLESPGRLSQSNTLAAFSGVVVTLPTWSSGRPFSRFIARIVSSSGRAASAQKFPKA